VHTVVIVNCSCITVYLRNSAS